MVNRDSRSLAKHAPDDPFTLFNQAEAFFRQGRPREAYAVFNYSPLSFRKGAAYYYALARYLCALDQHTLALTCLGKAFDADPSLRMKAFVDPDESGGALSIRVA
jgi:tetratricopeptide (TPR) repeat protein